MNFGNGTSTLLQNIKRNVGGELKGEKNVLKTIKHKDTISDAGSPWNTNHQKMGKYISKMSLALFHPAVACSWTQTPMVQERCFYVPSSQGENHQYNQLHFLLEWGWGVCGRRNWEG